MEVGGDVDGGSEGTHLRLPLGVGRLVPSLTARVSPVTTPGRGTRCTHETSSTVFLLFKNNMFPGRNYSCSLDNLGSVFR